MIDARDLDDAVAVDAEPVRVRDVVASLRAINTAGEFLAVHPHGMDELLYTTVQENFDGLHNHFQGIQRLYDRRHVVVSGSNWHASPRGAELYMTELGSRRARGPWLSNVVFDATPPPEDRIVAAITLDDTLWHAGGLDVLGPILAVPLEHNDRPWLERIATGAGRPRLPDQSAICFLDVGDPTNPKLFRGDDHRIVRPDAKAGAVALTRLPNGHYLCGAWSDSDRARPPRLDLYLSEAPAFDGRFRQRPDAVRTWIPKPDDPHERGFFFQTINFLHAEDGRLYLIGFHLAGKSHCADIYTVDIPNATRPPAPGAGIEPPIIRRITPHASFACGNRHCDMRGATGAYVTDDGITIYSTAQFRQKPGDLLRFCEFRPPLGGVADVTPASAWVELYDHARLTGGTLTLRDLESNGAVPNYKDARVRGRHFGDRARSARWQVPVGFEYVLYKHHGFRERVLSLRGTGRVENEPDFDAIGVGGEVSSSRLEPADSS